MIYKIDPITSPGKDLFAYWEDFLTNEELNYLVNNSYWNNIKPAAIGGTSGVATIKSDLRETGISWLIPDEENKEIWRKISNVISIVNSRYFKFDLTGLYEPMQLGLYHGNNGGHYGWHTDAGVNDAGVPRKLSMVILLNDPKDFTGGQLQIKTSSDEPITLELKRGRAWFFPSYVLHQVTPVLTGIRKSAVLWIGGPEFK